MAKAESENVRERRLFHKEFENSEDSNEDSESIPDPVVNVPKADKQLCKIFILSIIVLIELIVILLVYW